MKRKLAALSSALLLCLLAAGCSKAPTLKAVKATTAHVETTISTTTTGTVDAEQQAVLAFGTIGRVEAIFVKAGAEVRKGQLLAKLENRDAQSEYDNALKDLERSKELFKDRLVSQANVDQAQQKFEMARALRDKTEIRAPFAGVITEVNLQIGELSQTATAPDKPPLRLVDRKPRIIKGNIDEVDLSKVKAGSRARIKVPAAGAKPHTGVVDRVVSYVNTTKEQERTSRIELKLTEPDQLLPVGASAEIEIIVDSKEDVLAVPSRAILGTGLDRYVYRHVEGRLQKVPVKTGIGNYDRTEILEGVQAGDVIILPGDLALADGMKAKVELTPWP